MESINHCPICVIWARMPYQKRWSTPTTAYDTEGALVIGYWIATRYEDAQLCQKHLSLILRLNQTQAGNLPNLETSQVLAPNRPPQQHRVTNHIFEALPDPIPPDMYCSTCGNKPAYTASAEFNVDGHAHVIKQFLCSEHALALATKESKPEPEEFKLGLKPLTNENTTTDPPPLPVMAPLVPLQPNINAGSNSPQIQSAIDFALQSPVRPNVPQNENVGHSPPQMPVDPTELARQAALMPATLGRRIEVTPEPELKSDNTK